MYGVHVRTLLNSCSLQEFKVLSCMVVSLEKAAHTTPDLPLLRRQVVPTRSDLASEGVVPIET